MKVDLQIGKTESGKKKLICSNIASAIVGDDFHGGSQTRHGLDDGVWVCIIRNGPIQLLQSLELKMVRIILPITGVHGAHGGSCWGGMANAATKHVVSTRYARNDIFC